jgi:glycosyltransferase involved in cell wall biosynthesis
MDTKSGSSAPPASRDRSGKMLLSLVIPVYNEEEALPFLLPSLAPVLAKIPDCDYEIIFVNDGSRDKSWTMLCEAAANDPRLKLIHFSRNFGHQPAISAGLDFATGDAVVVMDADLQDPPELLITMVERYREGYDVVSAQRTIRHGDSWMKRKTASWFYTIMRRMVDPRLVPEVGDFRLFSHRAVRGLCNFREQHRFMRGLVAWLGLREAIVPFERQPRAAGETKYPAHKMLLFAWTAISSFSAVPLRLSFALGLTLMSFGFLYSFYAVYRMLFTNTTVVGWTSLVALQCLFSGATMFLLGLVGDYIAHLYEESKDRPLYVIDDSRNFPPAMPQPRRALYLPPVSPDTDPRRQL